MSDAKKTSKRQDVNEFRHENQSGAAQCSVLQRVGRLSHSALSNTTEAPGADSRSRHINYVIVVSGRTLWLFRGIALQAGTTLLFAPSTTNRRGLTSEFGRPYSMWVTKGISHPPDPTFKARLLHRRERGGAENGSVRTASYAYTYSSIVCLTGVIPSGRCGVSHEIHRHNRQSSPLLLLLL